MGYFLKGVKFRGLCWEGMVELVWVGGHWEIDFFSVYTCVKPSKLNKEMQKKYLNPNIHRLREIKNKNKRNWESRILRKGADQQLRGTALSSWRLPFAFLYSTRIILIETSSCMERWARQTLRRSIHCFLRLPALWIKCSLEISLKYHQNSLA